MKPQLLISLLALNSLATAQNASPTELEACANLANDAERLNCFDALMTRGRANDTSDVTAPAAQTPVVESRPSPSPVPTEPAVPARAGNDAVETPTPRARDDLGIEQINTPESEAEPDTVRATVVDVTQDGFNYLYFHLDNGNIWRQVEARYFRYPRNGSFEVEISQGLLGEYQMRVNGRGRMTRIRRVE